MTTDDALDAQLAQLAQLLVEDSDLDEVFDRVARLAPRLIEACDSCGVSLAEDDVVTSRGAIDATAELVDQLQYEVAAEGPCLDAIRTARTVRADELVTDPRWPTFGPAAGAAGVVASYSVPLIAGGSVVGSLNLYSGRRGLTEQEAEVALDLALTVAAPLRNTHAYGRLRRLVQQLEAAVGSRDLIGQAKGRLMERHDVDADTAFELLRQQSQDQNRKLREVAASIASERTVRTAGDPAGDADDDLTPA